MADLMVAIVVVVAVVISDLVVVVVVVTVIDGSFVAVVEPIAPVASILAYQLCTVLVMPPFYLTPPVGVVVLSLRPGLVLRVVICVGCREVAMHIALNLVATVVMVVMAVVMVPVPSHLVIQTGW